MIDVDEGWRYTPAQQAKVEAEWDLIRTWDCDYCGARGGEGCWNRATGKPFAHGPGHHDRIVKAHRA